ncbi:MAG: diphthine--ammonia ligase [Candidatus Bathyarchaeia archaeon]
MKVVVSWSGGKDSCFACYKAIKEGYDVAWLLVMMESAGLSNFHLINSELLDAQAQAIGVPIIKQVTSPSTYGRDFENALLQLKQRGVEGLVTGDVYDVALHEASWLDRVCGEVGLQPVKPLWHRNTMEIVDEFINAGFKATVVRVKREVLGLEWLGRELNAQFIRELPVGVDPCGENGEFHTFVTDGPIFKSSIEIVEAEKTKLNGYGHLEIKRFKVKQKA